jgi:hypothetical protein
VVNKVLGGGELTISKTKMVRPSLLTVRYCAGVSHTPADVFLQLPKYGAYLLPARFSSLLLEPVGYIIVVNGSFASFV